MRLGRYPESTGGLDPASFQCAGNRPFEADGWRRIPDSAPNGVNAGSYDFDAQALGCRVLPDSFELRAQVRAVTAGTNGAAPKASAPSTEARMRDEAPRVIDLWLDTVQLDALQVGDDLLVTAAFTEPVRVYTSDGSPTLALGIGEATRQATFASASKPPAFRHYGSGHIGSRLTFRYRIQDDDDLVDGLSVPENAIGVTGGSAIMDATGASAYAADLRNRATTLAQGSAVVAAPPQESLTAAFQPDSMPAEHDGETGFSVQVEFGEPDSEQVPDLRGLTLSAQSFLVTGGEITEVAQLEAGDNQRWAVDIEPASMADVSVSLGPTSDCEETGAVCTADGRKLSGSVHAVVKGPPRIGVADAEVLEGPEATMDFVVTLSRPLTEAVSVDYATADGTAFAGEDYSETAGRLTFAAGEISRTVSVAVADDAHDDDGETFTLRLSNATGANAYIGDDTATGTIRNSDPMPKAWIARFGRTVSSHVVSAIEARLQGAGEPRDSHLALGGLQAAGAFVGPGANAGRWRTDASGLQGGLAADRLASGRNASDARWDRRSGFGAGRLPVGAPSNGVFAGGRGIHGAGGRSTVRDRERRRATDMLMNSSFFWSIKDDEKGSDEQDEEHGNREQYHEVQDAADVIEWSAWGNGAATQFRGEDGPLSLNGEVSTAMLGADARWNGWLGGVLLAHSKGEGAYAHKTASGGDLTSTLTSLHPYAQYQFNKRSSVWATLGYGVGDLSLTAEGGKTSADTDLRTTMAAVGGRSVLSARAGESGMFELALRSDAMLTETVSAASENLVSATGTSSRMRLTLEGTGSLTLGTATLMPTLEAGLRYDGGDAETGAGLEVGGGLGYSVGRLTAQVNGRLLAAHRDAAYEEWGFGTSLGFAPETDGKGLQLRVGSTWGATQSTVQSMWSPQPSPGFGRSHAVAAAQRFEAEFGYGIVAGRRRESLWTPFLNVQSGGGQDGARVGVQLTSGPYLEGTLEAGLQRNATGHADQALGLQVRYRW